LENDPLTWTIVTPPAHGALSGTAPNLTYTPAANYSGSDSFTYHARDASLDSNVATVTIAVNPVNDAPVAVNDAYSTNEDTLLTVNVPGVLANDSDPDTGTTLTAALVSGPGHAATFALNANGSFSYTPAARYNGTDSFTYRASDGSLASGTATVTITITPVNDPPVAVNDAYSTNEDTLLTVNVPGVLANDTDPDTGTTLTAALVSGPGHAATFALNANGSFSYAPAANYNGTDSFTYRASDGSLTSGIATVTITITPVNDSPVAANDTYSTNQNVPLTISAPGVLTNDVDPDGGTTLTALLIGTPVNGTVTLNANGSFTYTPNANFAGTGSFTYYASDGSLNSNIATVTITVQAPVNQPPSVSAGPDKPIVLPNAVSLEGTAGDDGLPNPPGVLTTTWSKVSGPGTVTFANPNSPATTATFSKAGSYTLRLTANDSALASSDDVVVSVRKK